MILDYPGRSNETMKVLKSARERLKRRIREGDGRMEEGSKTSSVADFGDGERDQEPRIAGSL